MNKLERFFKLLDEASVILAVFGIVFLLVIAVLQLLKKNKKKKLIELKKSPLHKVKGIVFGAKGRQVIYSPAEADGHILTCAATGMGKTTTAITSLREWGCQSSSDKGKIKRTMYCIDISGDIEKNCPKILNKLIYEPLLSLEEENKQITPYNIFGSIDALKSIEEKNEALEQLAILLMPEKPNMNDNARFFLINGRKILISALIAYYHKGLDFPQICEKIMQNGFQELFADIDKQNNEEASVLLNSFYGANETNTAGCLQQCQDAISLFGRNPSIKRSIRRPKAGEIAIEPKMLETHNIFLKIPEDRLEMLAPLMRVFSSDIMNYITVRKITNESPMILLYWDEFGSLNLDAETVVLPGLRRARKRRCRIWALCQNTADFAVLYGDAVTRSILANFKYKLLLGGLGEPESQKYFAELIGYKKSIKKSVTKNAQSVSETNSEQREYIIEPADLDKQGKDWAILIASAEGQGYLKLKKKPYYKC